MHPKRSAVAPRMGDPLSPTHSSIGTITLTRGCSRRSYSGVGMDFASKTDGRQLVLSP